MRKLKVVRFVCCLPNSKIMSDLYSFRDVPQDIFDEAIKLSQPPRKSPITIEPIYEINGSIPIQEDDTLSRIMVGKTVSTGDGKMLKKMADYINEHMAKANRLPNSASRLLDASGKDFNEKTPCKVTDLDMDNIISILIDTHLDKLDWISKMEDDERILAKKVSDHEKYAAHLEKKHKEDSDIIMKLSNETVHIKNMEHQARVQYAEVVDCLSESQDVIVALYNCGISSLGDPKLKKKQRKEMKKDLRSLLKKISNNNSHVHLMSIAAYDPEVVEKIHV